MVTGLHQNKSLKRMKLRLNPIGYKYTQEIEKILELNNKKTKKEFKPRIENKIRELQTFEDRRESVFEELERKKAELSEKKKELDLAKAEASKLKESEQKRTKAINTLFMEALSRYAKFEHESHNLTLQQIE